jgi:hypothetical protein
MKNLLFTDIISHVNPGEKRENEYQADRVQRGELREFFYNKLYSSRNYNSDHVFAFLDYHLSKFLEKQVNEPVKERPVVTFEDLCKGENIINLEETKFKLANYKFPAFEESQPDKGNTKIEFIDFLKKEIQPKRIQGFYPAIHESNIIPVNEIIQEWISKVSKKQLK